MSAVCRACGGALNESGLACPSCRALVHRDALTSLARDAERHEVAGDLSQALTAWRQALTLLPSDAKQHRVIQAQVEALSLRLTSGAAPAPAQPPPAWVKRLGPFGGVALLLWKLKFVLVGVLTKGKLLLLGLGKASTLFSMLLSFGAYWTLFGWRYAAGLIAAIYVHEMGHVAALRRFGIPASAPMFIPGFGALVRLHARPVTPAEDARIGLAGPLWGLGSALVAWVIARATGASFWSAVAHTAAWINLFNLMPVWQLDGSRAFAALSRGGRLLVTAAFAGAWWIGHDGLLVLLALASAVRAFSPGSPAKSDHVIVIQLLVLITTLSALVALNGTR